MFTYFSLYDGTLSLYDDTLSLYDVALLLYDDTSIICMDFLHRRLGQG